MKQLFKKFSLTFGISVLLLLLLVSQVFAQANVTLLKSNIQYYNVLNQTKVTTLVTEAFNLKSNACPYIEARVRPIYNLTTREASPDYLVVYLLYKDKYLFETYKLDLENNYTAPKVIANYTETTSDEAQYSQNQLVQANYGDDEIEAVFATCITEFPSAIKGVKKAAATATKAGYKVKTLFNKDATVANYKYWLQRPNLKIFGNVGHGSPTGIMLADGSLSSTWFNTLSGTVLNNHVVYFNSCSVHNDPLEGSILKAGVQKFIGGDISLLVGPSEKVFMKFWELTLIDKKDMTPSVKEAESLTNYPDKNAHGISGKGNEKVNPPANPAVQ